MSEIEIDVVVGDAVLPADVALPDGARAVVVFAHGSGSSRHSRRNRYVAARLQDAGYGTVLLDLLTEQEDGEDQRGGRYRFDIALLADRLAAAARWARDRHPDLPVVLFGASTGGAAALTVAAAEPGLVDGVISRGGRPDLAADALPRVRCPVLLVVGGRDTEVLDLNQQAAETLTSQVTLAVVPGATHLFAEPGALDAVVQHALGALAAWVTR